MTNEALIHDLGLCRPWTTRELLDLTTDHVSSEEAIHAILCKYKCKAQAKPMDEAKDHS